MPAPINLANVSISLQQFQAVSDGKYNAGDVTLASETTLGKANNHVHRIGKNVTPLSQAEVMAVKQAFVKALQQGGVGADEINRVRRDLGLAPELPVDTSLRERSIKPLSRQQVREILDRNAATINATVGEGTIRTSDELYAGVSDRKRASRAQTREATNAAAREVERHDGLDSFQRIVTDDIAQGMSIRDRRAMATMTKEVLANFLHDCNGKPHEGFPATATWTDPATGAKFTLQAGCDEVQFVKMLEEQIVRLQSFEYKAALTNADWNSEIVDSLTDVNKEYKLLPGFRQMAMDAMAEAHAIFGSDGVREGATIKELTGGVWAFNQIKEELGDVRWTPDNLRANYMRAVMRETARHFLSRHIGPALAAAGMSRLDGYPLADNILKRHPELLTRLMASKSLAESKQILADSTEVINAAVEHHVYAAQCKNGLLDAARAIYSEKTGIPLDMLGKKAFEADSLPKRGSKLLEQIDDGTNPATTKAEISAAFDAIRDEYLAELFDMQRQIEETDLPRNAKDWMKFQIPGIGSCSYLRPAAIAAAARQIDLAPLEQAFNGNAPDDEIFAALRTVAETMRAKVFQIHHAATGKNPGGDQIDPIMCLLSKALLAGKPRLERQIIGFIGREGIWERFGDFEGTHVLNAFESLKPDDSVPMTWRAWATVACDQSDGDPKRVDALIAAAIRTCGDDADLRKLVFDNLNTLFVGGNARLREPWDVAQRIEDLKANLAELRRFEETEPGIYAYGLQLLTGLFGKALPKDSFAKLLQAAWEQPKGDMKGVSARSKGIAIHKAILQFRTNVERAIRDLGAEAIGGQEMLAAAKKFIINRMLASLSASDRAGLEAALRSDTGRKLLAHYGSIANGHIDEALIATLDGNEYDALLYTGELLRNEFQELDAALLGYRGVAAEEVIEPFPGHVPPRKFGAPTLERDVIDFVRQSHQPAAQPQQAQQPQQAPNPAADRLHNQEIASFFRDSNTFKRMPAAFREMVITVREEIRLKLGDAAVPSLDELDRLARISQIQDRLNAPNAPRVTPANMLGWYRELAFEKCAREVLVAGVRKRLEEQGLDKGAALYIVSGVMKRDRSVMARLVAAESPAAARAVLADTTALIDNLAKMHFTCERLMNQVAQQAREGLAARLGIPAAHLNVPGVLDTNGLMGDARKLASDIMSGKNAARTEDEFAAEFRNLVQRFVDSRAAVFEEADALDLSPLAKDCIKSQLSIMNELGYIHLAQIRDAARGISAANLAQRLAPGAPKEEGYAALRELYNAIDAATAAYFAPMKQQGKEFGADEIKNIITLFIECVLDNDTVLRDRIVEFVSRPDVLSDQIQIMSPENPAFPTTYFKEIVPQGSTEEIVAQLGTPQLPPLHAQALVDAVRAEGLGDDAEGALALFAAGKPAGDRLRTFLAEYHATLTPFALGTLARAALQPIKQNRLDALALNEAARTFTDGDGAQRAREMGYAPAELPRLARVFAFAKVAVGLSDDDALVAALDPRSKASRVFAFGGRFTASAGNFRRGLALLDAFTPWFKTVTDGVKANNAATTTIANAHTTEVNPASEFACLTFIMAEVAANNAIPLDADNPEAVFGMENNPAARFVLRDYTQSQLNTMLSLPQEKRSLVYAVFDQLAPLPPAGQRPAPRSGFQLSSIAIARILRNYDDLAALRASGNFGRDTLLARLFPDLHPAPGTTNAQIYDGFPTRIREAVASRLNGDMLQYGLLAFQLEYCGLTLEEAADELRAGRPIPNAPGVQSGSIRLQEYDGTIAASRLAALKDLHRPSAVTFIDSKASVLSAENNHYTVNLPGGRTLVCATGEENDGNVVRTNGAIATEIENLCRADVHPAQAGTVLLMLSQSGAGKVSRAFEAHNITNDEHMAVTFTLTRDDQTGAVTIRYSEPAGFPLRFHWESTVQTDGTVTSTPLVVESPAT